MLVVSRKPHHPRRRKWSDPTLANPGLSLSDRRVTHARPRDDFGVGPTSLHYQGGYDGRDARGSAGRRARGDGVDLAAARGCSRRGARGARTAGGRPHASHLAPDVGAKLAGVLRARARLGRAARSKPSDVGVDVLLQEPTSSWPTACPLEHASFDGSLDRVTRNARPLHDVPHV